MDIVNTAVIGIAFLITFLGVLRTVPKRRFLTILFLLVPLAFFSFRWSLYREAQREWYIGVACAGVVLSIWWLLWGRRLPAPDDSSIRVWTKDDPFE